MKNKKGFTLIELLAILVILAIISLIAIPVVLNIIDKVRVSSYARTADNILDASRIYFKETQIDSTMSIEGNNYDKVMENISGRKPDSGEVYIKKNGEIALTLKYDKYCYKKDYSDKEITRLEAEECELDENDPIITANSTVETLCAPITNKITSYFTIDSNGISGIESITCESDKDGVVENIEYLSSNKHTITCEVIKRNGKNASASINIEVGANKVGEKTIGGITVDVVSSCDGLYLDSDGIYRYKGSAPNNYIMIGDEEYRIMAIEDQGIKVIRSSSVTSSNWGTNNTWQGSTAQAYLYNTYYSTLNSVQSYIVEDATWNIGGVTYGNSVSLETAKTEEKSKIWVGKIGLITLSEYAQALSPSNSKYLSCIENISICGNNNWLKQSKNTWNITARASNSSSAWIRYPGGMADTLRVNKSSEIVPVVYLSSDIKLSGSGIQGENAFRIVES